MANDKQKCRVLVVDDNHDAAETLAIFLRMRGHDAYETSNPLEAVDLASALRPDVSVDQPCGVFGTVAYSVGIGIRSCTISFCYVEA